MSRDWTEFSKTLRDSTFATWFGWFAILVIIVPFFTSMVTTCGEYNSREVIELARIQGPRQAESDTTTETLRWMVAHGVHPLVARCAILHNPAKQCASMMGALRPAERETVKELLPRPMEIGLDSPNGEEVITVAAPVRAQYYVQGLDFGNRSPTE